MTDSNRLDALYNAAPWYCRGCLLVVFIPLLTVYFFVEDLVQKLKIWGLNRYGQATVCRVIVAEQYVCSEDFGWRGEHLFLDENGNQYEGSFSSCWHFPSGDIIAQTMQVYSVGQTYKMLYFSWYPKIHYVDFPIIK